jgi:prepilin-type N-terminal cleavage/methylation domain-containing protein/prepilin-type processing-associated H-X9-DG protein
MRKQDAFTLIELLVVIAIIALLMGILLPSLNKARQQGKKIVCTAHMKGLGISLRMYVDDNNGKTHRSPNEGLWDTAYEGSPIVRPFAPDDSFAYWGIAYYPYSKNKKVFHCPSTGRADDWPERGWGVAYQRYFRYCSYGINGYITWNSEENRNVMIDRDFKKHDEVIAFQDHIEQKLDGINSDMFCIGPSVRINLRQWRPASQGGEGFVDINWPGYDTVGECFRHEGLSNTCWLDGHVSSIKETTGEDVPVYWYTGVRDNL